MGLDTRMLGFFGLALNSSKDWSRYWPVVSICEDSSVLTGAIYDHGEKMLLLF